MSLKLYNSLSRKLEAVDWPKGKVVGLYTCGPTVYSTAHLGNLRTYVFEDVLRRVLELNEYSVKHVMNITDVGHLTSDADTGEDKIEKAARLQQTSAWEIAKEHEAEFFRDLDRLNVQRPSTVLRATETIQLQIDLIQKLVANGHAYRTSDGMYFDTSTDPGYGRLSKQKASEKKANARVEVSGEKKHPSDFALWKFSKPADQRQMEWDSPWGTGFPGWHIECSAMSLKEFPSGLDIHCGGIDHIAVHHENEIAQNEGAGYKDFVKIWMHGEFLVLPGKRMGKSEGNAVLLASINEPLFFRYLTLLTHYRKPLAYTPEALRAASKALTSLWTKLAGMPAPSDKPDQQYLQKFLDAVNDDLNTPKAVGILHEMIDDKNIDRQVAIATLAKMDGVLGLDLTPSAAGKHLKPVGDEFDSLLEEYEVARKDKQYSISDRIRKELETKGLVVEDLPDGTSRLRKR